MLAATMTVSVLAGCGGNQNEGNTNEKENVTNSNGGYAECFRKNK